MNGSPNGPKGGTKGDPKGVPSGGSAGGLKAYLRRHRPALLCLIAVALLCLLRFALNLPCPIQYLSGLSCPGCGMTRALWSLLTLDLPSALHYHPLSVALPIAVPLLIIFKVKGYRRAQTLLLSLCVALLIGVYLWRLIAGGGDVVVCAPREGLIGRVISAVFSKIST